MPRLSVNSTELHTLCQGEGPAILLVHGFPLDHSMWGEQITHLSKTHRVIAPDLRGFGRSAAAEPSGVSMDAFADDLASMLDALGESPPISVCGLSMGGYIAFSLFRRHPQYVRALILCDTKASADDEAAKKVREQTARKVLQNGPGFLAEAMAEKLFSPKTRSQKPEVVRKVQNVIRQTAPGSIAAASRGMAARRDSTELLSQIDRPTLVLVGEHDAITTVAEMRGMAQSLPRATFVEVVDAGHMAPLENPQAVNAAIDHFLDSI